jgi:enoyl-CoA hydratase
MGLAQACALRLGTPSLRMAMPETRIGLFPDVGGGHFLSKLPGALGEYLGVVGPHLGLQDALDIGWVDLGVAPEALDDWLTVRLPTLKADGPGLVADLRRHCEAAAPLRQSEAMLSGQRSAIDRHFSAESLSCIVSSLQADGSEWARQTLSRMAAHSPLMMAVTLAQVRRARGMPLADVFRMERTMVRHCFQLRRGAASETVEGVRALVVDKDHAPRWQPATIDAVQDAAVAAFFEPVWPAWAHPLRDL